VQAKKLKKDAERIAELEEEVERLKSGRERERAAAADLQLQFENVSARCCDASSDARVQRWMMWH
jgi:hypothetical protein